MDDEVTSWWDDPTTDWTRGQPRQVVDLLTRITPHGDDVRPFAEAIGLDWPYPPGAAVPVASVWQWALRTATGNGTVLDLVGEVLDDPASEPFRVPLRRRLGERSYATDARRALRRGLPVLADELDAFVEGVRAAATEPADTPVGRLEAITSPAAGFIDSMANIQALLNAMHRTAVVEVGGRPRGTGLLVGPDLLLTAAHVLDPMHWPPAVGLPVGAVFDYSHVPGRSPAETGTRIPVVDYLHGSLPTRAEVDRAALDWDAPPDRLDFALLRLAEPVPPVGAGNATTPRGHYQLDPDTYAFDQVQLLLIIQHPLGDFQKVSYIKHPPRCNGKGTRIRYQSNTLYGSSGSPVIDPEGRLVAIHHYSTPGVNQGVPASEIARTLLSGPCANLLVPGGGSPPRTYAHPATNPFRANELQGRPFVNRDVLRGHVRHMANASARPTLVITGERGSGVSCSFRLMSYVASQARLSAELRAATPGGLEAIRIDFRDYICEPVQHRCMRIAEDVTIGLGLRRPTEAVAQDSRNVVSIRQWIARELRHTTKQRWIFFDSIDDAVVVSQGGVDEFLHAIMDLATDAQIPLRVVLGGREADRISPAHTMWAAKDIARGLPPADVEQWLRERVRQEGGVLDEAVLRREITALYPAHQPVPPAELVASRLPEALLRLLGGTV